MRGWAAWVGQEPAQVLAPSAAHPREVTRPLEAALPRVP